MKRVVVLLLALLLRCVGAAPAQPAPLAGLESYIEQAMRAWEVPGLAIAVVHRDSVVYARGFGVRDAQSGGRVDEHTLFAIASTTKAMTAAALGMLVDEGKLHWDDPAVRHLPGLQLRDAFVTREMTIRDLLTHRSGLARSDNLWVAAPFDRAELIRRAVHLPASGRFRADYGYHNVMYVAAGEIVGQVAGSSWEEFLESRLFRPLGMTRSTARAADVARRENVSSSHTRVDGRVRPVLRREYENIGGAGGVWSSASDMSRWLRLNLGGGAHGGTRILADSTLKEMHSPQTVIRPDTLAERLFPETSFRAYGLGWFLQDYRGRKLVHHSGSINWTRTQVGMLPSEGVGVVVITNLSSSNLQQALMFRVLDAYLGFEPRDWSAEYLEIWRRGEARAAERRAEVEAARVLGTSPSLPLGAYAGSYTSDLFGEMRLGEEGGRLVLDYAPDYVGDLEHWHHDTFRATWRRPGFGSVFVTFTIDPRSRVSRMTVEDFGDFRPSAQRGR